MNSVGSSGPNQQVLLRRPIAPTARQKAIQDARLHFRRVLLRPRPAVNANSLVNSSKNVRFPLASRLENLRMIRVLPVPVRNTDWHRYTVSLHRRRILLQSYNWSPAHYCNGECTVILVPFDTHYLAFACQINR